jgi:hypothetical protein
MDLISDDMQDALAAARRLAADPTASEELRQDAQSFIRDNDTEFIRAEHACREAIKEGAPLATIIGVWEGSTIYEVSDRDGYFAIGLPNPPWEDSSFKAIKEPVNPFGYWMVGWMRNVADTYRDFDPSKIKLCE